MTPAAEATESLASSSEAESTATAAVETAEQQAQASDADGKSAEQKHEEKPAGAPEKYEFTAPEGDAFDPKVLGEFEAVARELNLPQESAQKMLDKLAPALKAKQEEGLAAVVTGWTESAKADKEFGGDKLTESLTVARKAMDQFGTPELRDLLNGSGLGNHPEIIRAFYRAGKAISDDKVLTSGTSGSSRQRAPLYPNSKLN